MELTHQQQDLLSQVTDFIKDAGQNVFIIRGYAGTGKTTMIKYIIPILEQYGKQVVLLAPTGRAAKVLSKKTDQESSTIHRRIYSLDRLQALCHDEDGQLILSGNVLQEKKGAPDSVQFWFGLKNDETVSAKTVLIVDEASMISSRRAANENLHFGSDILLDDLLTYSKPRSGAKVIFVGDPAQLPPVGDNRSAALDDSYFAGKGLSVRSYELTEVLRQGDGSMILENAMRIRDILKSKCRNSLAFSRKDREVEDVTPEEVVDFYTRSSTVPAIGDSVVICFSNKLAGDYNRSIRSLYFPGSNHVVAGDILQIVKNNVNTAFTLFNGDFVKVLSASDSVETMSAPVWAERAGGRERLNIAITFRDVTLLTESGDRIQCKIVDSLLNASQPHLTPLESTALYINFKMRHPGLTRDATKDALMCDQYYNAVQAKFGYAITGHKSQGGEWDTVYADYSGRTGLNDDSLRWAYTVTTRARSRLCGVNMPDITPVSSMRCGTIQQIGKPSREAFSYAQTDAIGGIPQSFKEFQKQKYLCVKESLDDAGFYVKSVDALQYDDRYVIAAPSGDISVDCYYNGAGLYARFVLSAADADEREKVRSIFENEDGMTYSFDYKPSAESFAHLMNRVLSLCDDLDIKLTNIVEHPVQYYIAYYLKTSGKFSQILFYFDKNQKFTNALPSSDMGPADGKLQSLLNSLENQN